MANHVYIATSLDGFIAGPDGGLDWLDAVPNPGGSDWGFSAFMERIDAVVMGRVTFETVLGFGEWPYTKPVFVLSRTLECVPPHLADKAEVISGHPRDVVAALNARGYSQLYVDGGRTIQGFLEGDLIDEMAISRVGVLLGAGVPLFGALGHRRTFNHVKTEVLNEQLTMSHYVRVRD